MAVPAEAPPASQTGNAIIAEGAPSGDTVHPMAKFSATHSAPV